MLLDCREPFEFEIVSLPGAVLLPMSELGDRHTELEDWKNQPVVVYCHLGGRSARVAGWLRDQGYEQAQSMAGGIDRWAEEVDPEMVRY